MNLCMNLCHDQANIIVHFPYIKEAAWPNGLHNRSRVWDLGKWGCVLEISVN